jgi:hypothetical protein
MKWRRGLKLKEVTRVEGVGEAFGIKAHHDVYKDPSVKGLTVTP